MILDSSDLTTGSCLDTDICIIGAGPAGIILAMELSEFPIRIILLESGGHTQEPEDRELSVGENTGLPYYPVSDNRYRALGGTTHLWAGWSRPLDPVDLKKRSWIKESGWPISHDELYPYYQRAHTYFSLPEFTFDPEYWLDKYGMPIPPFIRFPLALRMYHVNKGVNFGHNFSEELKRSKNIRVILHATVTEILTEKKESHISGIVFLNRSKKKCILRANRFILACGGIENARLLLSSATNRRVGLGNLNDQVGRYFMEHLHFNSGIIRLEEEASRYTFPFSSSSRPIAARICLSEKFQYEHALLNYNMALEPVFLSSTGKNDRRSVHRVKQKKKWEQITGKFLFVFQRLRGRQFGFNLAHTLEQIPNPNSRVYLGSERDHLGQQKICVHWALTDQDRDSYIRNRQMVLEKLSVVKAYRYFPDYGQDQKWPPDPLQGSRGHHMGTTRMSADQRKGVVDKNCRVHGTDNLFIAGSSVFPTSGSGTPTYTIAALAIRLADHLKSGIRG